MCNVDSEKKICHSGAPSPQNFSWKLGSCESLKLSFHHKAVIFLQFWRQE